MMARAFARAALVVLFLTAGGTWATLPAQGTCWRPLHPSACRGYLVTDLTAALWLNPPYKRFDPDHSPVLLVPEVGYLRAVTKRDAIGATLGVTLYNRRRYYCGIESFCPDGALHLLGRWDHWVGSALTLRAGIGTPILTGERGGGTVPLARTAVPSGGSVPTGGKVSVPGLDLEAGARLGGLGGFVVRMERQRMDSHASTTSGVLPVFWYPYAEDTGSASPAVSTVRTDWYVGATTHGRGGTLAILATAVVLLVSWLGYSS